MFFFKRKKLTGNTTISSNNKCFDGLYLPPNQVEVFASEEQLLKSVQKIKKSWTHLGNKEAFFSVITDRKYLTKNLDLNLNHFWQSGIAEADIAIKIFERYQTIDSKKAICVECGCGVGRVTFGLARYFSLVYAYDISDSHLSYAIQGSQEKRIKNIQFLSFGDSFREPIEKCDFFYSKIVFQHNPPPLILFLIKQVLIALKINGIAVFQVPVYKVNYKFNIQNWLQIENVIEMEMHCLPQQHIFQAIVQHQCIALEVWEDNSTGAPERYISQTFIVKKIGTDETITPVN